MKGLVLSAMVLFSVPSFACRIDINAVNKVVADSLIGNLEFSEDQIVSQRLVHSKDIYPEVMTSSCPEATLFFHSFIVKRGDDRCEILTKYKMSYQRMEISPFRVLDMDCHN